MCTQRYTVRWFIRARVCDSYKEAVFGENGVLESSNAESCSVIEVNKEVSHLSARSGPCWQALPMALEVTSSQNKHQHK